MCKMKAEVTELQMRGQGGGVETSRQEVLSIMGKPSPTLSPQTPQGRALICTAPFENMTGLEQWLSREAHALHPQEAAHNHLRLQLGGI